MQANRLWSTVQLLLAVMAPATAGTVQTGRIGPVDQSRVDVTMVLSPKTVKRFAKATDLRIGDISLRDSTVNAGITV